VDIFLGAGEMVNKKKVELIGLYKRQLAIYQDMYIIAKLQYQFCDKVGFVEENSIEEFKGLILKRRKQMDLIEEIGNGIEIIYDGFREGMSGDAINMGLEQHGEYNIPSNVFGLEEVFKKTRLIIKEIISLDVQIKMLFQKNMESLRQKVFGVQTEKKLLKSYYHLPKQKEGYFIDNNK
jgi:hypothetical protein